MASSFTEGLKAGAARQTAQASQQNAYTNALKEKRLEEQKLKELELNQRERDLAEEKFSYRVAQDQQLLLAKRLRNASEQEKEVFFTSDPGKALTKFLKKYLGPAALDEKGNPIILDDKEYYNLVKAKVESDIAEKVTSGQPLSPGETNYLTLVKNNPNTIAGQALYGGADVAEAYATQSSALSQVLGQKKTDATDVDSFVNSILGGKNA